MPLVLSRLSRIAAIFVIGLAVSFSAVYEADARRAGGGGFGSRGTRTFQAPAPTRTAPSNAAPIERSMTPRPQNQPGAAQPAAAQQQRPGLFGGMGRSLIGGLLLGGLIGTLFGAGFGGAAGFLGMLLQIGLVIGAVMLAMRFFRSRQPSTATAGAADNRLAAIPTVANSQRPRPSVFQRSVAARGRVAPQDLVRERRQRARRWHPMKSA